MNNTWSECSKADIKEDLKKCFEHMKKEAHKPMSPYVLPKPLYDLGIKHGIINENNNHMFITFSPIDYKKS